jgi:hypothetical protein
VGVAVAVAVAVGVGVGVIPPQQTKVEALTEMVSMRHPLLPPGVPVSVASRKRSLIVCPLTFGPRFATVVM